MKLCLGTAQFGLAYGIANTRGQVNQNEVFSILAAAHDSGIRTLDTAMSYGNSENVLGEAGVKDWDVVGKLPASDASCVDISTWMEKQVLLSLQNLGIEKLYGLLLHRPDQLLLKEDGINLYKGLILLKEKGLVERIGISIYRPEELDSLFENREFDLVQAPLSIIDRRMVNSGWLKKLHQMGVELHVRSIFLQGLLLMNSTKRQTKFQQWDALWQHWDNWLAENSISALAACLRYTLSFPEISKVIVGVDSQAQLQEIISASAGDLPSLPVQLQSTDENLVNPGLWGTP